MPLDEVKAITLFAYWVGTILGFILGFAVCRYACDAKTPPR